MSEDSSLYEESRILNPLWRCVRLSLKHGGQILNNIKEKQDNDGDIVITPATGGQGEFLYNSISIMLQYFCFSRALDI